MSSLSPADLANVGNVFRASLCALSTWSEHRNTDSIQYSSAYSIVYCLYFFLCGTGNCRIASSLFFDRGRMMIHTHNIPGMPFSHTKKNTERKKERKKKRCECMVCNVLREPLLLPTCTVLTVDVNHPASFLCTTVQCSVLDLLLYYLILIHSTVCRGCS